MRLVLCSVMMASVFGCGSNPETRRSTKALSDNEAPSIGFPKADPPAETDAGSKVIASKIIAAHTNNDPTLLAKMKSVTFGREGKHVAVDSPFSSLAVNFTMQGKWPNFGRYVWTGLDSQPFTLRIHDKQIYRDVPDSKLQNPIPEKLFNDVFYDFYADWLQLLVPLGEQETIVGLGPEFKLGDAKLLGLRVWYPGKPQAILYYDPTSFRVLRLAYDGRQNGMGIHIELALSEHKPINGFLLAHRVFVRMNGRDNFEYVKATLEFPKDHPAKLFAEP